MTPERAKMRERSNRTYRREALKCEGVGARDMRQQGWLTYSHSARMRARARAERWTRNQAARLGVGREEILEAIKRGFLPDFIAIIEFGDFHHRRIFGQLDRLAA